jgi:hypothetical protein
MKWSPTGLRRTATPASLSVRKETEIDQTVSADLPMTRNVLQASWPVNSALSSDEPPLSFPTATLSAKHAIGFAESGCFLLGCVQVRRPDRMVATYRMAFGSPAAKVEIIRSAAETMALSTGYRRLGFRF